MSILNGLHHLLDDTANRFPEKVAIEGPANGSITYRELRTISDRLRDRLVYLGVRPGDRVGVYLRKSIDAVTSFFGILKSGAVYVPVDPSAPASRNAYILHDCSVSVLIMEKRFEKDWRAESGKLGARPELLLLDEVSGGESLREALNREQNETPAPITETVSPHPNDLAYILYTSGSTGKPKGVMLSHGHALSFIDWCSTVFSPDERDSFSSHAPFHFDLSILDIYVPIRHGATLVLISEEAGKDPFSLTRTIADKRITIWYSTPSILSLMAQYGRMDEYDYSSLRAVLFAGEVFPVRHLRALRALLPGPKFFNLYGPTETNVVTFYLIPDEIPEDRTQPYPIGKACSHAKIRIVDDNGNTVPIEEAGELWVSGPAVMRGYWNLPEQTAHTIVKDPSGIEWYRTGDVVIEETDGNLTFLGRRDRMVKRHGYRIELGEIEAALYKHPSIKEAAVIALPDMESGVRMKAFICSPDKEPPSIIDMKKYCAENLPSYMVPDLFSLQTALPRTSTDKIDYQKLKEID